MPIKPRKDDPECIAALARIPQTADGPDWTKAEPADAALAEELIRYYWRFAANVAGQTFKLNGSNSVPRSVKNRVSEYQEEYANDRAADPDEPGDRPPAEYEPDGVGQYLADFESDVPRLIHKAAAAFDPNRARGKFAPLLATVISNAAKDWTKRHTIPGMSLRGADEPPEFNVAETFDREDLG